MPQWTTWKQVVALIEGGTIKTVMQDHSLGVWMKGIDGKQYTTREPKIDAVLRGEGSVDPAHEQICFITE